MAVSTSKLLQGLPAVQARLDALDDAAEDLSDVWGPMAQLAAQRENTVFASNGLGRWAPMAAATIREHQSPLVDTGIMREGLTGRAPIWSKPHGAAFGVSKTDPRAMNRAVLASSGFTNRGGGQVPKRVVVPPLRAAERRAWIGLVAKHLRQAIR